MSNDAGPLLTKFQTARGYYAYDTNTGIIAEVDKGLYEILPEISFSSNSDLESAGTSQLTGVELRAATEKLEQVIVKSGLFKPVRIRSRLAHPREVRKNVHSIIKQFEHMTLVVTERCNLRCRYCAYSGSYVGVRGHTETNMTWDTAKAALDYFLANRGHQIGTAYVGFYGGEPWLNWPVIRKCVTYLSERAPEVRVGSTTNGTLLTDALADYLAEQDFNLLISLDGPLRVHDRNRVNQVGKGSFDRVWTNVIRLRERHPEYYARSVRFRATMSSVGDYVKAFDFFMSYPDFFSPERVQFGDVAPGHSGLDHVKPSELEKAEYLRLEERFRGKLMRGETEDRESKFLQKIFDKPYLLIHRRSVNVKGFGEEFHCTASCFPGHYRLCVQSNGVYQICEKVNDALNIGDVANGIDVERVLSLYESFWRLYNGACRRCWAVRLCNCCFLHATRSTGHFDTALREKSCQDMRNYWKRYLASYCSLLEQNPSALDYTNSVRVVYPRVPLLDSLPFSV